MEIESCTITFLVGHFLFTSVCCRMYHLAAVTVECIIHL